MDKLLVYSRDYQTDLSKFGIEKDFALDRGIKVLEKLKQDFGHSINTIKPSKIEIEDILLNHDVEYFESLKEPETWLSIFEFKNSEYDPKRAKQPLNTILEDFRIKSGGTKLACLNALDYGLTANLGGGYHHAFPARGQGFCGINDIAITIKSLKKAKQIERALVIDLDFHQGDGTAASFKDDKDVFTLSVHSKEGWPDQKEKSDLDVEIALNSEDTYLDKTKEAIEEALSKTSPDLCIFVAGSDPYEKDILPGSRFIKLSLQQMIERDHFVIDSVSKRNIPMSMVFAGGYGPEVWEVHYHAVKHLLDTYKAKNS